MAKCKYAMREHQVSNDNGFTWTPLEVIKGDLIEYGSPDCPDSGSDVTKWVDLEGDYICEDNKKYKKQVMYISYDDGVTWYIYYPTAYRKGEYIGVDDSYCSNKFEGHYVESCYVTTGPQQQVVTTFGADPLKIVKCDSDSSSTLTTSDTSYYRGCVATSRRTYRYMAQTYTSVTTCCYTLTNAKIGNCVTEIGAGAFSGHTALSAITIPSSVTSIGNYAFNRCSGLTSITIDSSTPPTLGTSPFANTNNCPIYVPCDSLTAYRTAWSSYADRLHRQPSCPEVGVKFYAVYRDSSEYSTECDGIGVLSSADTRANSLTILDMVSATIGNCVTSIGDNAFYNPNVVSGYRSVLSSVTIPSTVTSIGNNAFRRCSGLTSVSIPNNVTSIGENAFYESGVKSIILPSRLTSISNGTFNYCSGLTSVLIPNGVTSIGDNAFYMCSGLTSITIPSSVTSIGIYAFGDCDSLSSVTIDGGSIGNSTFRGCNSLKTVTLGNNVTSIGNDVFNNCTSLTSVVIPSGVTSIGENAFFNCRSLSAITIPNTITSIGYQAFAYCISLTSCTIGSGVTSISGSAFNYCSGLTSITINATTPPTLNGNYIFNSTSNCPIYVPCNSVDAYKSASGWSTYKNRILPISSCTYNTKVSMYYVLDDGDVTLRVPCNSSSTLSSAETKTFYSSSSLREANIGNCVTSIGNSAFTYCNSLSSVTIPNSVTSIGDLAFSNCSGLISCTIPSGVTSIGLRAFERTSLRNLTIQGATNWGSNAFSYCTSLSSCTIGNGVTNIGHYAFIGCSSLKNVTFGSGLTSFGTASFSGCSSLTNINIPNSVTRIGSNAFEGCSGLTSVSIPSGVTEMGGSTFKNCRNLGEVIVNCPTPPSIYYDFDGTNNCPIYVPCGTLSAYTSDTYWSVYENRLQEMSPCDKQYAWNIVSGYSCSGLTKMSKEQLQVSSDGTTWENVVPEQTRPTLPIIEENSVDCAKFYAEYNNGEPNRIVECNNTTLSQSDTNTAYPYTNNSAMTTAIIGDCVTSIDMMAFAYCSSLTNINIPNSVTSIGYAAFEGCSGLTSVNIPSGVTSIADGAFSGCTSLSSMTIPSSVTSLGDRTFYDCSGLTSITIDSSTPPSIGYYTFYNANKYPIYVPCDSIGLYKTSGNWGYYADRVFKNPECPYTSDKYYAKYGTSEEYRMECDGVPTLTSGNTRTSTYPLTSMTSVVIGDCVTSIGNRAFEDCSSLTSVTIPNSVTSISQQAFYYCSSLTNIDIPSGVTEIGASAFAGCTSLTSVNIPSGVTSIEATAFSNCSSLTSITIPNGVTSIDTNAFNKCTSLTSIDIPDSVTSIGYAAFANCGGLTSCTIGSGVTSLSNWAFRYCSGLTSIDIPNGVTSIGEYAFQSGTSLTSVTIGSGVTSIGQYAFQNCTSLTSVTINATTPPTLGTNVFTNNNNCPIYVPTDSVDAYKTANRWSTYASRIQAIP